MHLIGIDTGGTFTDFVYFDGERFHRHKRLSTPDAPEQAILAGIAELGVALEDLRVIHGSTVATNAVLEGKGARTVYITNHGLGDVLTIGRGEREELYNLMPPVVPPPVPADHCLETGGRLSAQGAVVEDLSDAQLAELRRQVERLAPEAAAVNLLFSFLDDRFERRIAAALPDPVFVSLSSAVLPVLREYERGIATWLNAYVGPLVHGYLSRLQARLRPAHVSIMRSSGDVCGAQQAAREAVHLLLSGPAAGLVGAQFAGAVLDESRLLTLDMGGTSTDVALIDGAIRLTDEGRIGRYPVAVPMADIHTIGAGGGSIAYADPGGNLQVGPGSAGADPGPACYGRGGDRPTVTDANLVLGRLPADARLAGSLALDAAAARAALARLAAQLGLASAEAAAQGVVSIVNEQMVQALRVISVQRGVDPRQYMLVAFGGAGGLHVCALAAALGSRRALVPVRAGVLSALGMLAAPAGRQMTRSVARPLADLADAELEQVRAQLVDQGREALRAQGVRVDGMEVHAGLDLCYQGQAYTLNVPWQGRQAAARAFHEVHEQRFGHRLDAGIEVVNVRVSVSVQVAGAPLSPDELPADAGARPGRGPVHGMAEPVPWYRREGLAPGADLPGPAIIRDADCTTFVDPGWCCRRDRHGNLLLERRGSA